MKLTKPSEAFLRRCAIGPTHTSPATGGSARSLEERKLVTLRYRAGTEATITDLGREVLAALDDRGRQTTIPRRPRRLHRDTTCPHCHRGTKLRAPPAPPELFAHRDSNGRPCPCSGMTIELAKAEAQRRRIARRLFDGETSEAIAEAEGTTAGMVGAVATLIADGRITQETV